ncbi:MAG: alpha/beta hydrolase fold protein [Mycobacterium sp.]|nr:alpha/beta hydrolase fold protein [Mycobacterium sp.]
MEMHAERPRRQVIAQRRCIYGGFDTRELHAAGRGPTLVLLHGFSHSSDCWHPVLTRLARCRQRAIAVDLPGFGRADPIEDGAWLPQLDRFVADIAATHGPVVLVGNSLGGLLALRAAESARALPIRGVLAVDAAGTGWAPVLRLAALRDFGLLATLAALPTPAIARHVAVAVAAGAITYGRWWAADPAMIRLLTSQIRTRRGARALVTAAVAIVREVNSMPPMTEIDCPVTVLHGRRDLLVSVAAARRLHRMIPHSDLVLLDGVGHCPQLDAPDTVVRLATRLAAAAGGAPVDTVG